MSNPMPYIKWELRADTYDEVKLLRNVNKLLSFNQFDNILLKFLHVLTIML